MKDRADYARKGIARGRSVVVLAYTDGILFVADEHGFVVMGGLAEQISGEIQRGFQEGMELRPALKLAVAALGRERDEGEDRKLSPSQLEVAVLDRGRPKRKFRRIAGAQLSS